jgi:glycosyltransferase involved in cell wall biosynthesis
MTKRIAFVTTQVSPFQVELAEAINANSSVNYKVIFTSKENTRPAHWLDMGATIAKLSSTVPSETSEQGVSQWALDELRAFKPDVVLIGGVRGKPYDIGMTYRQQNAGVHVGFWLEQPLRSTRLVHKVLRWFDYAWRLRRADFVLAIGDRAHSYYRQLNSNTHFVPYGSDLSPCFKLALPKTRNAKIRFLFSGGLHERHNFPLIMACFSKLLISRGPIFEFVVSGRGDQQGIIDAACEADPALEALVRYDRDFETWHQRLDPFLYSDVFLYPTNHAGWGIVIPEAMAAGLLVISSRGAEASRYLIDHGATGLLVENEISSLLAAMERAVDNREWVNEVGIAARRSAQRCHATTVAEQLRNALRIATGGQI